MPMVIFNIGWMKFYRGTSRTDRIVNGGLYVQENESGGEIYNFEENGGWFYGYVQPPGQEINLERMGAAVGSEYVDNVTVVFTATKPGGGGFVVGWYRNARVWRQWQPRRRFGYYTKARKRNCTLIDHQDRGFPVPRKGSFRMGQSNIRYVEEAEERTDYIRRLKEYIEDPEDQSVLSVFESGSNSGGNAGGGGPRQSDPFLRSKVEKAAVQHVIDHFVSDRWNWTSVEAENKGWDLEFRKGARTLRVEVKGFSGKAGQVELTPNEYSAMHRYRNRDYRLAIVKSALTKPRLSLVEFNGIDEIWQDQDGRRVVIKERTSALVSV